MHGQRGCEEVIGRYALAHMCHVCRRRASGSTVSSAGIGGSDRGSGRRWQTLSAAHERAAASAAVGAAGGRNGDGSERLCVAAP
eukprot:6412954-Prymnesium_polylepis.1